MMTFGAPRSNLLPHEEDFRFGVHSWNASGTHHGSPIQWVITELMEESEEVEVRPPFSNFPAIDPYIVKPELGTITASKSGRYFEDGDGY